MWRLLVGLLLVLATGFVHGLWTNRWKLSDEPGVSCQLLSQVAMNIGDWEGRDLSPLDEQTLTIGEIEGYLTRVYVNRQTGQEVAVMILCGRGGPIAQHTPDICYG